MSLSRRETSVAYHHQYVRTGAISFCRMKYGSDVRIDTENNDDFYLIQIPLSGTDLQQHDRNSVLSDSHRATLHMPGDPLHMHWSNDCEKLAIRIERQYLDQLGSAICGRNVANELSMNYEILLNDARGQALKQRAMLLFSEMTTTPDLFSHEIILQQNIENLSSSLLLWYSNVQQFNNQQKILPRHVRLATDYLEANAHLPIDATRTGQAERRQSAFPLLRLSRFPALHSQSLSARNPFAESPSGSALSGSAGQCHRHCYPVGVFSAGPFFERIRTALWRITARYNKAPIKCIHGFFCTLRTQKKPL